MKAIQFLPALGGIALLIAGCATEPAPVAPAAGADAAAAEVAANPAPEDGGATATPAYNATGTVSCSVGSARFDQQCEFGVVRTADATTIEVMRPGAQPGTSRRVIVHSGSGFATDGIGLRFQRRGGDWLIGTEDRAEFYRVPNTVIAGG